MSDLEIIKEYYGFNTKDAKNYIKTVNKKAIESIKKNFEDNAKKCFYTD